jgi:hypothetical protein
MKPIMVKPSVETRDRIRALGGVTYEDTIVEALDVLEPDRFWARAEAVAVWRRSCSDEGVLDRSGAEVDAAFDGIERSTRATSILRI